MITIDIEKSYLIAKENYIQGNVKDAEELLYRIIKEDQNYINAFCLLGNILLARGDYNKTIILLDLCTLKEHKCLSYFLIYGIALRSLRHLDFAKKYLLKALDINPKNEDVISELALCLQEDGDIKNAINYYKELISINPNNTQAQHNLGSCLLISKKVILLLKN